MNITEDKKQFMIEELMKIEEEVIEWEEKQNQLELKLLIIIELNKMENLEQMLTTTKLNGFRTGENFEEQKKINDEEYEKLLTERTIIRNEISKVHQKMEKLFSI